jgi:CubicO group peptidase (beta-lactamase class C family)
VKISPPDSSAGEAPTKVHDHITALLRDRSIPGLCIAVTDQDRLLFARGYGQAVLDPVIRATPFTSSLWFSMSKLVAGIANPLPLRWVHPAASPAKDDELLDQLLSRHPKPKRAVGAAARYSNLGYLILSRVISVAAGMPFTDYVHEVVLRPAGMSRTGYRIPPDGVAATGYVRCPRGTGLLLKAALPPGIVGQRQGRQLALRPFLVDGAAYGGLVGNVGNVVDAARFARLQPTPLPRTTSAPSSTCSGGNRGSRICPRGCDARPPERPRQPVHSPRTAEAHSRILWPATRAAAPNSTRRVAPESHRQGHPARTSCRAGRERS